MVVLGKTELTLFCVFYFSNMKYLKWLWIVSTLFATGYCLISYVKNGFDDLLFASWVTLVSSGIVLLYKK